MVFANPVTYSINTFNFQLHSIVATNNYVVSTIPGTYVTRSGIHICIIIFNVLENPGLKLEKYKYVMDI